MNLPRHEHSALPATYDEVDVEKTSTAERRRRVRASQTRVPSRATIRVTRLRLLLACLSTALAAASPPVAAQAGNPRGELLYSTHCVSCHTAEVHWRDKKLATDTPSLRAQVQRWASNIGLNWTDDDIGAVTRYLNAQYYRFPAPDTTATARASPPRAPAP